MVFKLFKGFLILMFKLDFITDLQCDLSEHHFMCVFVCVYLFMLHCGDQMWGLRSPRGIFFLLKIVNNVNLKV